jgi:ComF family protein
VWWWRDLLDCVSDRRCPGCMGRAPRGREVCAACDAMVARSGSVLCLHCLRNDPPDPSAPSGACRAHGSRRLALVGPRYEPPLDRVLHAFKYDGARRLMPWIASLVPELPEAGSSFARESVLVPVPLHPARRARRGFDQALLLAEAASARWGIPVVHPLERVRDHEPQARLDPARRRANVRGVFRVVRPAIVRDRPVLLMDDVVTTGSTLLEAASALEGAGAAWILGLAPTHGGFLEGPEPMAQGAIAGEGRLW